jgi:hypothetical protein
MPQLEAPEGRAAFTDPKPVQPILGKQRFRCAGDVIADGTDLHGDAVNVAARLQAECPRGAIICVARVGREHLRDRIDLVSEELGALNLKNIARDRHPTHRIVALEGTVST